MYFKEFPQFLYDFNYGNTVKTSIVQDITRNIRFKKEILSNIAMYDTYHIVDGETPEVISEKFYGTPEYHWVIMIANEKYDYRYDFPVPEPVLQKHIHTYYNPILHSSDWSIQFKDDQEGRDIQEQRLYFVPYGDGILDPNYLTHPVTYTVSGKTDTVTFSYTFPWPDIRYGIQHNGLEVSTQTIWQAIPYPSGTIVTSTHSALVTGHGTHFTSLFVGMDIVDSSGNNVGRIKTIESDTLIILQQNAGFTLDRVGYTAYLTGNPVGELTITTIGREHNPVYFVNSLGAKVPYNDVGAIPVTGDTIHRQENDAKREIKIISPSLLEAIIRNYEEELL
jgi:hypothetical protein